MAVLNRSSACVKRSSTQSSNSQIKDVEQAPSACARQRQQQDGGELRLPSFASQLLIKTSKVRCQFLSRRQ
eukprot:1161529-Pelagomonas_calceolata.AAC.3